MKNKTYTHEQFQEWGRLGVEKRKQNPLYREQLNKALAKGRKKLSRMAKERREKAKKLSL